jgi:excisionase family DNA binding protein
MHTNTSFKPRYLRGDKAAAKFLGVTDRTVRNWMAARVIPYIKLGSVVLFDPFDLEKAMLAFKRNAEAREGVR